MEIALIASAKILEMFVILVIGIVIVKTKVGDHETGKRLSAILLNVISPCLILMSYQMEFNQELLQGLLTAAGLSAVSFLVSILLAQLAIRGKDNANAAVERMAVIYSNCGFIGLPIANAILGSEGVFYMTAYMMVYNIFIWSHGLLLMSGKASSPVKTLQNIIQPSTVAIVVSLLLFVGNIRLPEVLANPIDMIGDMNTPVAMLVSGINLANSDILGCLKRKKTYVILALKLFAVPLLTLLMLMMTGVELAIALTVIVAAACPTGAMVTMFALQYHRDSQYASELFTITTVLSLITIPVMILISTAILA